MKAEQILTLDIGADGMRMAVVASLASNSPKIIDSGCAWYDVESQLPKEAVTAMTLKRLLDEMQPAVKRVAIALDGQSTFSRLVKLPKVGKNRVQQTIRYEAVQNIPFPIDEVVWDAYVMEPESDEPEVLLVAVKSDLVDGIVHAVKANGLTIDSITVAPVALANAAKVFCNISEPMLLVDGGAASTHLAFIDGHRVFFRSVPVPGNDAVRRQQEIDRSISFYTSQQAGNPPTQIVDSLPGVDTGLAVCLGLGCSPGIDIDLLPPALRRERDFEKRHPWWLASAVVLMLTLGVWIFALEGRADALKAQTTKNARKVSSLSKIEQKLQPLEDRIFMLNQTADIYRDVADERNHWLRTLAEINRLMPEGMFLLGSDPIDARGLRISVVSYLDKEAEGQDAVKLLRDALRSSEIFSDETSVNSRPSKKEFARKFVLDVYFEEVRP